MEKVIDLLEKIPALWRGIRRLTNRDPKFSVIVLTILNGFYLIFFKCSITLTNLNDLKDLMLSDIVKEVFYFFIFLFIPGFIWVLTFSTIFSRREHLVITTRETKRPSYLIENKFCRCVLFILSFSPVCVFAPKTINCQQLYILANIQSLTPSSSRMAFISQPPPSLQSPTSSNHTETYSPSPSLTSTTTSIITPTISITPKPIIIPPPSIKIGVADFDKAQASFVVNKLNEFSFAADSLSIEKVDYNKFTQYKIIYLPTGWSSIIAYLDAKATDIQLFLERGGGLLLEQPDPNEEFTPQFLPYKITFRNNVNKSTVRIPSEIIEDHYITMKLTETEIPRPYDFISSLDENNYAILARGYETKTPTLVISSYNAGRIVIITSSYYRIVQYTISDELLIKILQWLAGVGN